MILIEKNLLLDIIQNTPRLPRYVSGLKMA